MDGALLQALKASCAAGGLQPVPAFLNKCIQLWETILVRHGLMTVGATFSGQAGISCTYSDSDVRSNLGFSAVSDVATFSIASEYAAVLSVAADGTLSALATHWAKAPVAVTNACDGSEVDEVSLYINPTAAAGERRGGTERNERVREHRRGRSR